MLAWFPVAFLTSVSAPAQEVLDNQPAPKAVPVEDLLPKFDGNAMVMSQSEQLRVSGGDAEARGTALSLAVETNEEFLRLTEGKADWKVPVHVMLMGQKGGKVPKRDVILKLGHTGERYEIMVYVDLSRGLRPEPLKRSLTEALAYASGLADIPFDKDLRFSVPPWFVDGLQEATAWRMNQSDRKLYDSLSRHGGLFKLDQLLSLSEADYSSIDAASKAAFQVSAGALVMALLEQPDGKEGFRAFLTDLASFQGEMPVLLRRHFPDLNLSASSLEKWWKLQLANKGTAPLTESLSVVQTERALSEALRLRHHDAEGALLEIPVSEWETIAAMEEADRVEAIRLAQSDLLRLSYRSFPSYRMLLMEYQGLLSDLAKGETKNMAKSLAALAETRATMVSKAERARDFMDWFEITRARETSGAFDDYLDLKARLKSQQNPRKDGMSGYLDRLDPLFALPEDRRMAPMQGGLPQF